jgi:xylulose-5-phosphate/fructose-6-phosphate phosphoketolase
MFNQHAKWLSICNELPWRQSIASLNLLITSTVWRQDHNGFTHQDPGLSRCGGQQARFGHAHLFATGRQQPSVSRRPLFAQRELHQRDRQRQADALQYLDMDAAITHCTKGISIWSQASNDQAEEPDVVMACAGDIPTQEALAATAMLREEFPELKIRFINVVDLFKMQSDREHPHGLSDLDFDSLFTLDKPIVFNFHGYPWLIHRLAYSRNNHKNLHVRGYKERGNINTRWN